MGSLLFERAYVLEREAQYYIYIQGGGQHTYTARNLPQEIIAHSGSRFPPRSGGPDDWRNTRNR